MLKLATSDNLESVIRFCDGDLLGTRIACYCLAYGFDYDFLNIWYDDTDGKINTVIAKFYDTVTVITDSDEIEETADFIRMIGFETLECDLETCRKLAFEPCEIKKAYIFRGTAENLGADTLSEEHYKALYELVSLNIPGSFENTKEAYLSFLSDLTYKSRRGLSRSKGIVLDGKLVSSVITSAETASYAILSAVASDSELRGRGLGRKTVLTIADELIMEGKTIFVVALNKSAEGFYEKLGFEHCCDIAIVR